MPGQVEPKSTFLKSDLFSPWVMTGIMFFMLVALVIVCQTNSELLQQPIPEAQRTLFRTLFYAVAIVTFPLTSLIRYILLRLNQTMPFSQASDGNAGMQSILAEAKKRYRNTVVVSVTLIESVGILGLVMFIFGDGFNTLYIFTGMAVLGLFLHRPKQYEYHHIVEALSCANT